LEKVVGPGRITPTGHAYPVDNIEDLKKRLAEFNPIDNLKPLAKAGVKIFHIHGDKDELVPMAPNSEEMVRRYRALGGQADLEVLPGLAHGGIEFRTSKSALRFLTE
jgi:pimeloyl-ACP methyl ester carboxylesterase